MPVWLGFGSFGRGARNFGLVLAMGASLLAGACTTSGKTTVQLPAMPALRAASIGVVAEQPAVPVDAKVTAAFDKELRSRLGKSFAAGDEVTARYRSLEYNPGNRAMRYMVGFGAGKGVTRIAVSFVDRAGKEVGRIEVDGKVSGGVLGGSSNASLAAAADEVAAYARKTFNP